VYRNCGLRLVPDGTPWDSDCYLCRNVYLLRKIETSFLAANVFGNVCLCYLPHICTETDLITRVPFPSSSLRKPHGSISKGRVKQIGGMFTKTRPVRCFRPALMQLFPQQIREFLKKGEGVGTPTVVAKCASFLCGLPYQKTDQTCLQSTVYCRI
jgi:hypothetical protein